jgi:hypothetical protein
VAEGQQHLLAAARAQHQHLGPLQQVVGQRRRGVVEVAHRLRVAVVGGDRAQGVAVGEHAELRRRLDRVVQAEAGRVAEGDGRALDHREQAERAGALLDDAGVRHRQRDAQALELGHAQGRPRRGQPQGDADRRGG